MKSTKVKSKRWRYWYIAFLCMIVGGYFTATIAAKTQRSLIIGKITDAQGKEILAYKESHALLIGVSDYTKGWPDLPGVQKDIPMVKTLLEEQGFTVDVVMNPTRTALEDAFDNFINKYGQEPENRLIFYFSGHGHTLKLSYGKEMGYIVPSDAPNPNVDENGFLKKALTMKQIEVYALQIQAKHALFLFDSCFSGSLFAISRAVPDAINYKTANPVRQFITSGSENETVPDRSVFRDQFVQALRGEADSNHDGYVTGSELGEFLQTTVVNYSNDAQHPQYGKIRDAALDKGDFVFRLATIATPTPAPATVELPPINEFNLDDLKVKDEWQTYLQKIETAFASVQTYEQQAISTDNKIEAWKRFAEFAAKDNPSSTRDDELRRLAQERIAYWKGNILPTPTPILAIPTPTPMPKIDKKPSQLVADALIYLEKKEYDKVIEFGEKALQATPDNPVAYDTIARAYIAKKPGDESSGNTTAAETDVKKAEEYFKKALEKKADHVPSILGLGDLYGIQKRYFESMVQYQQALALKQDSSEAHIGLGGVYRMVGKNEQALQEFEAVLKLQPKSKLALFNAADILLQIGNYNKSIKYINTLLVDDSENTDARYLLAQAYAEKGEITRAIAELETIVEQKPDFQPAVVDFGLGYLAEGDFVSADTQFKALLRLNEKHTAGMIGVAIVAQKTEMYADAVSACERALSVQPDSLMTYFVLGNIYIAQGDYEKAKDAFKKSGAFHEDLPFDAASIAKYYGENPKNAAIVINVATSLMSRGWYREGIAAYLDSDFPKAAREGALVRSSLARAYTMQRQYEKAIQELEAILAAQPELKVVYKNIGNIYYQSKEDAPKAIKAYKKFLEAKPDDAATRVQLALTYETAGMMTKAAAEYEKILQAMPDSALTMNQLAWLYAERGEHLDKALELATKASQSRPAAGIIDTLGWVHFKRQKYDAAIEAFQRALELSPFQATIRYHLGQAYAKRGDKTLAIQELEIALNIEPNFKEAEDTQKLLDELTK